MGNRVTFYVWIHLSMRFQMKQIEFFFNHKNVGIMAYNNVRKPTFLFLFYNILLIQQDSELAKVINFKLFNLNQNSNY